MRLVQRSQHSEGGVHRPEPRRRSARLVARGRRPVPIQCDWSILSEGEKRPIAGIATAIYTAKVQTGKSVIKITTSQSAAEAANAIGSNLVNGSDLFPFVLGERG